MAIKKVNKDGNIVDVIDEDSIQVAIVAWARHPDTIARYPGIEWLHHSHNGGKLAGRTKQAIMREGAARKARGVKKGIPDLFLPYPIDSCHGLYIEVKTATGRLTPEQDDFRLFCKANGYRFVVVRSLSEFICVIRDYYLVFGID